MASCLYVKGEVMAGTALSEAQRAARSYAINLVDDYDDSSQHDHDVTMDCRDLEDRLTILTSSLRAVVELRALEIKRGERGSRPELVVDTLPSPEASWQIREIRREAVDLSRKLQKACSAVNEVILKFEKEGYDVKGSSPFRKTWAAIKAIARMFEMQSGPRPVLVDDKGRIMEMNGDPIVIPGLEPERILRGIDDAAAGRVRPLMEIIADRDDTLRTETD
jgi:hypothetical protein